MKWWKAVLAAFLLLGLLGGCLCWTFGVFLPKLSDMDPGMVLLGTALTVFLVCGLGWVTFSLLDDLELIRQQKAARGKTAFGVGMALSVVALLSLVAIIAIRAGDAGLGVLLWLMGMGGVFAAFSVLRRQPVRERRQKPPQPEVQRPRETPSPAGRQDRAMPSNALQITVRPRQEFPAEHKDMSPGCCRTILYPELTEPLTPDHFSKLKHVDPMQLEDETSVMEVSYSAKAGHGTGFLLDNLFSVGTLNGTRYLHRTGWEFFPSWPPEPPDLVDNYCALPQDYFCKSEEALRGDLIAAAQGISDVLRACCEEEGARFTFPDDLAEVAARMQPSPAEAQREEAPATRPEPEAPPEPPPSDGFEVKDGVLIRYTGPGGTVVVPEGVTEIGKRAFADCSTVTDIVLPQSLKAIGDYAFLNCRFLQYPAIPEGVTIGRQAFTGTANPPTSKPIQPARPKPQPSPAEPQREEAPATQPAPAGCARRELTPENILKGKRLLFLTEAKEERGESVMELVLSCKKVIIDEHDGTLFLVTQRGKPGEMRVTAFEEIDYDHFGWLLLREIEELRELFHDLSPSNFQDIVKELPFATSQSLCLAEILYDQGKLRALGSKRMPSKNPPSLSGTLSMQLVDYGVQKAIECDGCYYDKQPIDYGCVVWLPENFFKNQTPVRAAQAVRQLLRGSFFEDAVQVKQLVPFFEQEIKQALKERMQKDDFKWTRVLFLTEAMEERDENGGEPLFRTKPLVIDEDDGTLLLLTQRGRRGDMHVTAVEEISYARLPALLEARGVKALQQLFAGLTQSNYKDYLWRMGDLLFDLNRISPVHISSALPMVSEQKIPCTSDLIGFELTLLDYGVQKALYYHFTWEDEDPGPRDPHSVDGGFCLAENFFEIRTTQEAAQDLSAMLRDHLYWAGVDIPPEVIQAALDGASK